MAAGKSKRIARAVDAAEELTGMQLCVYLGPADGDPHGRALSLFEDAHPSVLLLVAPDAHAVEIVTAEGVRDRVTDEDCAAAIDLMRPLLRRKRYDKAIVAAVEHLARAAGPGAAAEGAAELPDVIDEQ